MELIENEDGTANVINSISTKEIKINDQKFNESCIVTNSSLIKTINLTSLDDLTGSHIELLLSNNPQLIIIGSGNVQTYPNVNLLQPIAENNIGFEVMNNQSAVRTYNILQEEQRKVSCLLIINNN